MLCVAAQKKGSPAQQSTASRSGEMELLRRMNSPCAQFCSSCFCATKSRLVNGFSGEGKGIFTSRWVFSSRVICGNLGMLCYFF